MKENFLYQKIYNDLSAKINSGEYSRNMRLPDEKWLGQNYNVSAITVKKALNLLAEQGLVERIPGKGSFVRAPLPAPVTHKQNHLIGIVLEHVSSPFGLSMLYKMDEFAEQAGYKSIFRFSYGEREKETGEIDFLLSCGVAGLIIMPSHGQHYNPAVLKLVLDGFPVILVDKMLQGIDVPSVRTDNADAMHKLVDLIKSRGHRRIGLITTGEHGATSTNERREGFYLRISAHDLPVCSECRLDFEAVLETQELFDRIVAEIRRYLEEERGNLDAVICSEYGIIPKLATAARELGITLEKDIAVCCIDEDYLAPGGFTFSHMKQNESEIAEQTIRLLLARINRKSIQGQSFLIPAVLRENNVECTYHFE